MYHLGMNVGGENEDSRNSFQSATDSEHSGEQNRSPAALSASQHNIPQGMASSFNISVPTHNNGLNSSKVSSPKITMCEYKTTGYMQCLFNPLPPRHSSLMIKIIWH